MHWVVAMLVPAGNALIAVLLVACLAFWALLLVGVMALTVWMGLVVPVRGAVSSLGHIPRRDRGPSTPTRVAEAFAEAVAQGDFEAAERAAGDALDRSPANRAQGNMR